MLQLQVALEVWGLSLPSHKFSYYIAIRLMKTMAIIYQPEPDDVLCGRGENSFRHRGNYYFRHLIVENSCRYKMAATRKQKSQVVSLVANTIIQKGGRFLIRSDDGESWRDGGLKQGKLKTGHAFRDVVRGRFKSLGGEGNRTRAQHRSDNNTGEKKQPHNDLTNDAPLESTSSSSLPSIYNTIEPSKEWKTATCSVDTELANDLVSLFYTSESRDAVKSCGSCISQSTKRSQASRFSESEANEQPCNHQQNCDFDHLKADASNSVSLASIHSTVEPSKDWKTASIDAELANYVRNLFFCSEATKKGPAATMLMSDEQSSDRQNDVTLDFVL